MEMQLNSFRVVPGFFHHHDEPTGPSFRAKTLPNMGLINRVYGTDAVFDPKGEKSQWERFVHYLESSNKNANDGVQYKLIFLIRHGQGYHNLKEAEVGRQQWESYWSHLDGDGNTVWADSHLAEKGKQQAQALNDFWRNAITAGMPTPQRYYTSPLTRCLETTSITYSGLDVPADHPFRPIIKENLRERYGKHTCDRRSSRSWIAANFPGFRIESTLTETDELWEKDVRESEGEIADRVKMLLQEIFQQDDNSILSFTAHSGFLRALYHVIGHPDVWVSAGAMVPVLIRAS
ncbi:phosphoglycerate mutase-like protein [Daldinia caldariorum]|uniref:phosphoglycerate mutase-like protein n=1 Tax=Daldinia caldariorum TaxID=326644 RepID=UPI002008B87E|nr:phosphoglycerate mutase-like protein [Daldinia caldariorum]KAI1463956.1 phosphoglycerate mutase-like protein [Daldinia caldariorum]